MISVIVPIYKVEKYLRKCVESIQAQTYRDLEIILVDDGSPDGCPALCDELAENDSRIKVVHKVNGGLSIARNEGMKHATGDYITFIDSDDTINPEMFESMLRVMTATNADISMCGSQIVTDDGTVLDTDQFAEGKVYQSGSLMREVILPLKTASWNKLFKRTLTFGHWFPEGKIHGEDLVFILYAIDQSTKLVTTGYIGYNYFKRVNSITTSSFNARSFDEVWCKDMAVVLVREKFPEFEVLALAWSFRARMNLMRRLLCKERKYKNVIKTYTEYMRQIYPQIRCIIPLKLKTEYALFMCFKSLYVLVFSHK